MDPRARQQSLINSVNRGGMVHHLLPPSKPPCCMVASPHDCQARTCSTLTVSCRRASCWWRLLMPPSKAPMRMLGSRAGAASAARSWWLQRNVGWGKRRGSG
eukprot:17786-Chlamydomonas_euryale.AAC.1